MTLQRRSHGYRLGLIRYFDTYLTYLLTRDSNHELLLSKSILSIAILRIFFEMVIMWITKDLTDDKSLMISFYIMVWYRQATSHYLKNQCWPRYMSPYMTSLAHNDSKCLASIYYRQSIVYQLSWVWCAITLFSLLLIPWTIIYQPSVLYNLRSNIIITIIVISMVVAWLFDVISTIAIDVIAVRKWTLQQQGN